MSQKKLGVIISYISEVVRIATGVLYTPIMLHLLGDVEYGLYQLIASTMSYLSLLNFGFNGAYVRYYVKEKDKSEKHLARLNGMFIAIFAAMSILCLICGFVIYKNAEAFFGNKLTIDNYREAKDMIIIFVIAIAISFPTNIFSCYINANEQFAIDKFITLVANLLNPTLGLILLFAGYGNVGLAIVVLIVAIMRLLLSVVYCLAKLGIKFSFRGIDFSLLSDMFFFTFFIFLNQIIDQINWNLDKYLLGRLDSLKAVAIYGVGSQLNSLYISYSNSISSVFAPQINKIAIIEKDDEKLSELFLRVGRIQYYVVFLVLSGFAIFGKKFIILWAGKEYIGAYSIALVLMIFMMIPLIQNIGIEIQRAKNAHKVRSIVYMIMSIVNIIISIPLINKYGALGAAMGTCVSLLIGNIVFMNIFYEKRLNINIKAFWKSIIGMIPASLIVVMVGYVIGIIYPPTTWGRLAVCIFFYVVVYLIINILFSFNNYEKSLLYSLKR